MGIIAKKTLSSVLKVFHKAIADLEQIERENSIEELKLLDRSDELKLRAESHRNTMLEANAVKAKLLAITSSYIVVVR